MVRVPRGNGQYYYLEYRQPYGSYFDNFSSTDPAVNGVTLRLAPDYPTITQSLLLDATPATMTFADAPLAVGKSVTDPDASITFTTVSVSSTTATVSSFVFATMTTPSAATAMPVG